MCVCVCVCVCQIIAEWKEKETKEIMISRNKDIKTLLVPSHSDIQKIHYKFLHIHINWRQLPPNTNQKFQKANRKE